MNVLSQLAKAAADGFRESFRLYFLPLVWIWRQLVRGLKAVGRWLVKDRCSGSGD